MSTIKLLTAQKIISTKHFQTKFASVVKEAKKSGKYYNVVRNSESIGVFLPIEIWESILEDIEALQSPSYLNKIKKSRQESKSNLKSLDEAFDLSDKIYTHSDQKH